MLGAPRLLQLAPLRLFEFEEAAEARRVFFLGLSSLARARLVLGMEQFPFFPGHLLRLQGVALEALRMQLVKSVVEKGIECVELLGGDPAWGLRLGVQALRFHGGFQGRFEYLVALGLTSNVLV